MKTKLHRYIYDTTIPAERDAYIAMAAQLHAEIKAGKRGAWMHCSAPKRATHPAGTEIVNIKPKHLFGNQWNTETERVFDWYEEFPSQRRRETLKFGHWLEITPEMHALRCETLSCHYTGFQAKSVPANWWIDGAPFNLDALSSEYLKESELTMIRMTPVFPDVRDLPPLTEAQRAVLVPLYLDAQLRGRTARDRTRIDKQRRDAENMVTEAEEKAATIIENAKKERTAHLWLLDRGFGQVLGNLIYYSHTKRFCFGWMSPIDPALKSRLVDQLSEFPFDYDIQDKPKY